MPFTPASRRVLPAAVSVLSAPVVGGEAVAAAVLGVHGPALYLDVAGRVLPVVTADAVPLPTALRLAVSAGEVDWGVRAGDVVTVGAGRVVLPGVDLVVSRTWRPARVRPAPAVPRRAPALPRRDSGWLVAGIRSLSSGLECGRGRQGDRLRSHGEADAVADAVAALVGRGPGLTPSGDDALAGALLVAHALGTAAPLAAAVRARLGATTAVSAALLDAAADGFAARDVVTLVDAALAGDGATVAAVLPAVLAIGHSSGRDLVTGVVAAIDTLAAHPAAPTTDLTSTGRSAA